MTKFLDIHLANDAERLVAHENCHDVWSQGLDVGDHVSRRENSPLHRRARWVVGCLDGRVVAALASHPLRFLLHGRSLAGIGLASVHTLSAFRGQGLAQRLIRWIEDFERRQGARLSVLFCDIEPRYYGRLGYVLCPAHCGWTSTASARATSDDANGGLQLVPVDAAVTFAEQVPTHAALYDSDHACRPLAIERTTEYWLHLAARHPSTARYWLVAPSGDRCGYAWLRSEGQDLILDDHAVRDGEQGAREALFRQTILVAARRGFARAGGWFPACEPAESLFELAPRQDEITMLKPLDEGVTLDDAVLAAADWLQEIDHV